MKNLCALLALVAVIIGQAVGLLNILNFMKGKELFSKRPQEFRDFRSAVVPDRLSTSTSTSTSTPTTTSTASNNENPDINMNTTELITSKGYPCESYKVTTDDGYILSLIRIPHGRDNSKGKDPRPPVILWHGFLGSSSNFVENPANESLGFILADAGADVWLANSRGTSYSRKHVTLDPNENAFWNFTYDEMGRYDVPAVVKFVVETTGVDQIYYVGHTQGTTIALVAFEENKEAESHIKHLFALAPIARIGSTKTPLRMLAPISSVSESILNLIGHAELAIPEDIVQVSGAAFCNEWGSFLCGNIFFVYGGYSKNINASRIPVYAAHNPDVTSAKTAAHWLQGINSNKFMRYDYTEIVNLFTYGKVYPPKYDPSKVKVPVTVYHGGEDWIATPTDVAWLTAQLNVTEKVFIKDYSNFDFIWATNAPERIYQNIVDVITQK